MKVDVYGTNGQSTGRSVDLPDTIFGIEPNDHAVYLDIKSIQANQRQGTHKSKERGEIAGSTRKIKKQKGTGTARAGSIKSPIFRGGGRIFGPKPHKYNVGMNKKVKLLARKSALSAKVAAGELKVVENFTFDNPKTSEFAKVVNSLDAAKSKALFVIADADNNLVLSARNLPKTSVMNVANISTLDIMRAKQVFLSEGSISKLNERFSN